MRCNHCSSEWTTTTESKMTTCPFCGKQLENVAISQPVARGRFQLSYDKTTLVQFLGDEKNVVVPAGITRIGAGAFHGYGVETVYISDGVTEIGDNCFNGCKQLREVRIPSSVTYISDSAFKDTGKKKIIAEKGSYAWNKYAKPVAEDKPVAPATQAESKPISKTGSASPSKPVESAEKSGMPADSNDSKVPSMVQSVSNTPSAKELYEQQVDKFLALQHKKMQWAQLLGCEPGDRPWIIKASLFVSADKQAKNLIARIKNIHDQELLARIEEETNDGRVRLAAVENITDQDRLFSVVNDTQNPNIRRTAVERITDQNILRQLANNKDDIVRIAVARKINDQKILEQMALKDSVEHIRAIALDRIKDATVLRKISETDPSSQIREFALLRVGDSHTIAKFILATDRDVDEQLVMKVTSVHDLQMLAISGVFSVRKLAANLLPTDDQETCLLKAAAELSQQIVPYAVERFKKAAAKLQESNPSFLETVALRYPLPGVRYLARGETHINPNKTTNIEERLKSQTPSQVELDQRRKIAHCEWLLSETYSSVDSFANFCDRQSKEGKSEAEIHYNYSKEEDALCIAGMLRTELKSKGFTKAAVSVKPHYVSRRYYAAGDWHEKQELSGYDVHITTTW